MVSTRLKDVKSVQRLTNSRKEAANGKKKTHTPYELCHSDVILVAITHFDCLETFNHIITPTMQAVIQKDDDILEIMQILTNLNEKIVNKTRSQVHRWSNTEGLTFPEPGEINRIAVKRVYRAKVYTLLEKKQNNPGAVQSGDLPEDLLIIDALPETLSMYFPSHGKRDVIFPRGTNIPVKKEVFVNAEFRTVVVDVSRN